MYCKVGDKVRFLNDVGGGVVTRIIDKKTVSVQTEDGFEVPALYSNIVVVDQSDEKLLSIIPDNGLESPKTNSQQKPKKQGLFNKPEIIGTIENENKDPQGSNIGLFLALVPTNTSKSTNRDLDLFIINDSDYRLFYSISAWKNSEVEPIKAGVLSPDSKEIIKTYPSSELNSQFVLNVQALFYKNTRFIPQQPEYYDYVINPIKLAKDSSFVENDFFDENAYIITIADSKKEQLLKSIEDRSIDSIIHEKTDSPPKTKSSPKVQADIEEIDLHIEQLVNNHQDLSPGEIIQIQLARFEVALEGGIKNPSTKRMVFIHGLGNGKLKLELRKQLDKKYAKLKYQDASFKEYGYGATLVYIR